MRDEERERNHKLAINRVKEIGSKIEKVLTERKVHFEKQGGSNREWIKFEFPDLREIRIDMAMRRGYGLGWGGPTGGVRVKFTQHFRTVAKFPPTKDGLPKMVRLMKDVDSLAAQIVAEDQGRRRTAELDARDRKAQAREVGFKFPEGVKVSRGREPQYEIEVRLPDRSPKEVIRIVKAIYPTWTPEVKA